MRKNIFFMIPYPKEGASARLRVMQFLPYLEEHGFKCKVRPFLTPLFYKILYERGHYLKKIALFSYCTLRRIVDTIEALSYEIVFIHREAFPLGPPVFEAVLFLFRKKVVFDYDDAIYLAPYGRSRFLSLLKCPWKTSFTIRHSAHIIAGNDYLMRYAKCFNVRVSVIPTPIDTDTYNSPTSRPVDGEVVLGWIGSHTTQVFLDDIQNTIFALLTKYNNLRVHVIGGYLPSLAHERVHFKKWHLETELEDISRFSIGIMPIPDTEWAKGKCAFKVILYMSMAIPCVCSAIGANNDVIKDGTDGFLAANKSEWFDKLSRLIEDPALRRRIGEAGKETARKRFSVDVNAPEVLKVLETVCASSKG